MTITCTVSPGCSELAVGVCEACGKPFCETHAATKHKHLCHNDAEWSEPAPVKALKNSAYWTARRTARDKNAEGLCGVEWCQHQSAVKCVSCHQSFCASHVAEVTYLPGAHAEVSQSKGLPDARKGQICESCQHNHVDVTLVKLD